MRRCARRRPWSFASDNVVPIADHDESTLEPDLLWLGGGDHPLEVATVQAARRPAAGQVRASWKQRHERRPSPLVLVAIFPTGVRAADELNRYLTYMREDLARPCQPSVATAYFILAGHGLLADELEHVGEAQLLLRAGPLASPSHVRRLAKHSHPNVATDSGWRRRWSGKPGRRPPHGSRFTGCGAAATFGPASDSVRGARGGG